MNDDDDDSDEKNSSKPNEPANKNSKLSAVLHTSSVNDPILLTNAKCLNEDILCAWKRVQIIDKSLNNAKKSSEDDENNSDDDDDETDENDLNATNPPHLNHANQTLFSNDENEQIASNKLNELQHKKELWIFWYEKEEPPNLRSLISPDLFAVDTANGNTESILGMANTSHNGLPYECRSMLFKALHNLIEKSLLEKGYARLGKWFVMPYNLNSINYSSIYNNCASLSENQAGLVANAELNSDLNEVASPLNQNEPATSKNSARVNSAASGNTNNSSTDMIIDESNHVSYSFSFFLHGASRVCTSVDVKLHRPIRLLNKFDLLRLKRKMKQYFEYKTSKRQARAKLSKIRKFKGLNVILGPYGVSARLIGYVSNETVESRLTCSEWEQFYPLKLNGLLPNVFVVGVEANRIKFFYPNSFVYVVMDSDEDGEEEESDVEAQTQDLVIMKY
jgi:hypothetical protein